MSHEPDWLAKARAEGRITEQTVNQRTLQVPFQGTGTPFLGIAVDSFSEAQFQDAVCTLAHQNGWKVAHFRKVRVQRADGTTYWETPVAQDGKGFPDLLFVRAGEPAVYAELKVKRNVPSPEQWDWIHTLRASSARVYLWYPSDFSSIVDVLGAPKAPEAPSVAQELLRLADDGNPHAGDVEAA